MCYNHCCGLVMRRIRNNITIAHKSTAHVPSAMSFIRQATLQSRERNHDYGHKEQWQSGLMQLPTKQSVVVRRLKGSNPFCSANVEVTERLNVSDCKSDTQE